MLTKNIKTHYILIKEWDRNGIKKIPLTQSQYELYEEELQTKKHNDFFKIHDIDTQEVLFNGRASKIDSFEEMKLDPSWNSAAFICSFWTKHPLQGECWCKKKFDTLWILFIPELEKLWYKVANCQRITKEMQDHYLKAKGLITN